MNFDRHKEILLATLFIFALSASSFANVCNLPIVIWCQEFDGTGNAYSSQNDTNGMGLFAQVYDDFSFNAASGLTQVKFEGAYFNPPQQGQITGWTVSFYADNAGQPGALLFSQHTAGTGNETFDGVFGGFPTYNYLLDLNNINLLGSTKYWLSVYPDLGFPPQWGWSSGTGGDRISYQDFMGTRSQLQTDMAFALAVGEELPEPGTLVMLGTGMLCVAGAVRRKLF